MNVDVVVLFRITGLAGQAALFWLLFIEFRHLRLIPLSFLMALRALLFLVVMLNVVVRDSGVVAAGELAWMVPVHDHVTSATSNAFWIAGFFVLWLTKRNRE
jgi:hypothetical protein